MSVTATRQGDLPYRTVGAQKRTVTNVAFDSSYPTGGEPLTAATLGLNYVEHAESRLVTVGTDTTNVANAVYDRANAKLKLYDETAAEVADTSDFSHTVAQVTAFGY